MCIRDRAELQRRYQPGPGDAWFLVPADHPTLDPRVPQALLDAQRSNPAASIFIPTHDGVRGHPALLAWQHVERLGAIPPDQGINFYLRQQKEVTCEVPVPWPEILMDLDTPADYEALKKWTASRVS